MEIMTFTMAAVRLHKSQVVRGYRTERRKSYSRVNLSFLFFLFSLLEKQA